MQGNCYEEQDLICKDVCCSDNGNDTWMQQRKKARRKSKTQSSFRKYLGG